MSMAKENAAEISPRPHENSRLRGAMKTPKVKLTIGPKLAKRPMLAAKTTHHP
jgi:hypothetical protein